ncbi:MAG: M20/M25/M40 family metallo-hydrolase [Bacteroidaceae bacterium]|nr:M20/M25/M40 family metallo-hydrolase [Bacteroidaceae bacterium]
MTSLKEHYTESLELLKNLISHPSVTRNEQEVSQIVLADLRAHGYEPKQIGLNLMARGHNYDASKPNLLLNSHMDTVKPVAGWQTDPFQPVEEDGKLIGLGSNDAGASLVSLLHTFYALDSRNQKYNPIFLATCQEEVNGDGGMKLVLSHLPQIAVALIGEPTGMQPAIAEKGLMVLDFTAQGKAGHAAREEGINALYRAMDVISMLRDFKFESVSPFLGPVKMTVTMVHAGTQHNVIPDTCTFTADVRSNEMYSNRQIFDLIQENLPEWCLVRARSFNLNSSRLNPGHPIVRKAVSLGLEPYGSPTLSDQAVLACPSFKMGPGDSARSHTAGEYICLSELEAAVPAYLKLLDGLEIG